MLANNIRSVIIFWGGYFQSYCSEPEDQATEDHGISVSDRFHPGGDCSFPFLKSVIILLFCD